MNRRSAISLALVAAAAVGAVSLSLRDGNVDKETVGQAQPASDIRAAKDAAEPAPKRPGIASPDPSEPVALRPTVATKDQPAGVARAEMDSLVATHLAEVATADRLSTEIDSQVLAQPDLAIAALSPHANDPAPEVRRRALTLLAHAAQRSIDPATRKEVVDLLVEALDDSDSFVTSQALRDLYLMTPDDFSNGAKAQIAMALERDRPGFDVVKLAGYIRSDGQRERFAELSAADTPPGLEQGPRYFHTEQWAGLLALARLGDTEAMLKVTRRAESEPNEMLRVTRLLGDLGFTQRPEAFEVVRLYLDSDEKLPPVKEGGDRIRYAQHAIDVLARWLPGFPVARRLFVGAYGQLQIDEARAWMARPENWVRLDNTPAENGNG